MDKTYGPGPGLPAGTRQAVVCSVAGTATPSSEEAGRGFFEGRESRRAELRMNTISEVTWINAASTGFRNPKAASATPAASTPRVPAKLVMMLRRHRRAILMTSTTFRRSLPRRSTLALSRAISVPEPIAIPTLASISAGASLIPSPTIATVFPALELSNAIELLLGEKLRLHLVDSELISDCASN